MCDLEFDMDSKEMIVSNNNGKTLSGIYKISGVFPEQYSLTEFVDGRAEGKSTTKYKGVIIREKYFKNGLPDGLWLEYDDTGKSIIKKLPYSNGILHGIGSVLGKEIFYWDGKRVSKQAYYKNQNEQKK